MKKRYIFSAPSMAPIAMLFILGELLFNQVYLHPVSNIHIGMLSIPVYGYSIIFILKIIIFDLGLIKELIEIFISRRYYGFPYSEVFCYPFSALCIINFILIILNIVYSIVPLPTADLVHPP